MKQRTYNRRQFVAGVALGASALAAPSIARAQTVVLKCNLPTPPGDPGVIAVERFGQLLEQYSKGSIRVQMYYSGALGKQQASINGVQNGILDMTNQTVSWLETVVPRTGALDLPYLFSNDASAERVLDGPLTKSINEELSKAGIHVVAWGTNGWREHEFVSASVTKPEDMRGLKIRVLAGPVYIAMTQALGATPVVLDISELFLALQQKVVDGLEVPPSSVLSYKFDEVTKHISLTHHIYNAAPLILSKARYESFTADQRDAVDRAGNDALGLWRKQYQTAQAEALDTLKQRGVAIVDVDHDAFRNAMKPVYDQYRTKVGSDFIDELLKQASA